MAHNICQRGQIVVPPERVLRSDPAPVYTGQVRRTFSNRDQFNTTATVFPVDLACTGSKRAVKCHIGQCTPWHTLMDSKKKELVPNVVAIRRSAAGDREIREAL